ncbi:MAG: YfhO family protein [Myxococcales bacterium]
MLASGEAPTWTPRVFTGAPVGLDPFSLPFFLALSPAAGLGWLIACHLLAAALGAYALSRRLGASRSGAFLSAFAYAWSGYFVCQLRHLGILGTVAYFPLALLCLEMAATGGAHDLAAARLVPLRRRLLWLVGFAAVFGWQLLAGFPQSAYYAALVYGGLTAARTVWLLAPLERGFGTRERLAPALKLATGALGAVLVAAVMGMAALLPMSELGRWSDRGAGVSVEWATTPNYWPPNALTFLVPYSNGDISEDTYEGGSLFWEDYGYVGLATVLLALFAVVSGRRRFAVVFWALATLLAYGLVVGRAGPFFEIAFRVLPGMNRFRFPTRFLFVVELGLALLGGLGLTYLQELVGRLKNERLRAPLGWATVGLVAVTVADLLVVNRRQNPMADAERWLAPPKTAQLIHASGEQGRVYSPLATKHHIATFHASHGWSGDLSLYEAHRELLQPNSNLLYGISSVDGYAGISPRWVVDLIGDHNRKGFLQKLSTFDAQGFGVAPGFYEWLEALSVRWLILPFKLTDARLEHFASAPPAELHRLRNTLPRARIVTRALLVTSTQDLFDQTISGKLDPRTVAVFQNEAQASIVEAVNALPAGAAGTARIEHDGATRVTVAASAPQGGLLLLADTFYPGWEATVDGQAAKIHRVNLAHRAVLLAPGEHQVEFTFRPKSFQWGFRLSALGAAILAAAALVLGRLERRAGAGKGTAAAT